MTSRTLIFLVGSEDSPSPQDGQDSKQWPSVRSKSSAKKSSKSIGPMSQSTTTLEPSNGQEKGQLLLRVASPAKTLAGPVVELELKAREVGCGQNIFVSFAKYDQNTSLWKTYQLCLAGDWSEFSGTWPRSGMMQNGTAYPLPTLDDLIYETAYGFWPTPTACLAHSGFSIGTAIKVKQGIRKRKSGATIGSSLKWDARFIEDYQQNKSGFPNPRFLEWLMDYPENWTELRHSGTASSPPSRSRLSKASQISKGK